MAHKYPTTFNTIAWAFIVIFPHPLLNHYPALRSTLSCPLGQQPGAEALPNLKKLVKASKPAEGGEGGEGGEEGEDGDDDEVPGECMVCVCVCACTEYH